MNLGDELAEVLPELQAEAESRMTDSIRFTRPGEGDPVWDGKQYVAPEVEVYAGPCALSWRNPAPQEASAGDAQWAVDRTPTVKLPISDPRTADVVDGCTGVFTAVGPRSAARVGMVVTVLTGHWQTDSTARRIPVQVVSRDAGQQ